MADVTLKYKGATIGELSETGNKTIETAGKYCEADILLEYVKSGGGSYVIEVNPTETVSNNNMVNSMNSLKSAVVAEIGTAPFIAMYKEGTTPSNYLTLMLYIPSGTAGNINDASYICRAGNLSTIIHGSSTSTYVNISASATYNVIDLSDIFGG